MFRLDSRVASIALILMLGAISVAVGCSSGKPAGTEGGACYGNGSCNSGLICLSHVCVSPGDGAAGSSAGGSAGGGTGGGSGTTGAAGAGATGGTGGGSDGGAPVVGVPCGPSSVCNSGSACCLGPLNTATCEMPCATGLDSYACDGPEDCNAGSSCCASASSGTVNAACSASGACSASDTTLCHTSQDCPLGMFCCNLNSPFWRCVSQNIGGCR